MHAEVDTPKCQNNTVRTGMPLKPLALKQKKYYETCLDVKIFKKT